MEITTRFSQRSQAGNTRKPIDVMAFGQSYSVFRSFRDTVVISDTGRNILNALGQHGHWHFYHDKA
jgi:hypothetical protein